MAHNLSFSINMPKTNKHSKEIVQSVNETFKNFSSDFKLQCSQNFFNLPRRSVAKKGRTPTILSEKTIMCEINSELWDKALVTSISSITNKTCPHFLVVQEIINYLLNSNSSVSIGLVEEFFWKLLFAHGPKPKLLNYYKPILFDDYLIISRNKLEDQNVFFSLIDALTTCLRNPEVSSPEVEPNNVSDAREQLLKVLDQFNGTMDKNHLLYITNYFDDLPWRERVKRCLITLNFVSSILEKDFTLWFQANESKNFLFKKDNRPFIYVCLWPEVRDVGIINKNIYKVLKAFKLFEQLEIDSLPYHDIFRKIITLLAEVFRCVDRKEILKYPFTGANTSNFAREVALKLYDYLMDPSFISQQVKVEEIILSIRPHWFRLLLCSYLLSSIIGSTCPPDLIGAYDILEHIAHIQSSKDDSANRKRTKTLKAILSDDSISQRHKKLKGINAKLSSGNTILQKAIEENNLREVRGLLKLPDLDVNATNHEGWTALHIAAYKGCKEIVNELLKFRPYTGSLQRPIDTRARGPKSSTPLMCAATEGHAEVCRLLLEHAGSVLLEDVNDSSQTPLDLAKDKEVKKIMKYYADNIVETPYSHRDINFDKQYKEIVIKLCVEMIQSYLCTYRTWDVYKRLKNQEKGKSDNIKEQSAFDYERYHRDINRNICILRKLTPKLQEVPEFKSSYEIFTRILSFNRCVNTAVKQCC